MERPVAFPSGDMTLRGVLHAPEPVASPATAPAIVFLHGWSGSRLGPHRMFVKTARRLTEQGFTSLRFDFRGRGESDGDTQAATIRTMIADAGAAIDFMRRETTPRALVLLAICSGSKAAIGAATEHGGVDGLALWSAEPMGPLRTAGTDTRKTVHALRQYAAKALQRETWSKLLTGQVNMALVRKAVRTDETPEADEVRDETDLLARFPDAFTGPILFAYGTNDPATVAAARNYAGFCDHAGIERRLHEVRDANHSFYSLDWETEVIDLTTGWLTEHWGTQAGND